MPSIDLQQPPTRLDRYGPALAWLILLTVSLVTRPPVPVDETRYLAVAWEMWTRGDLLVPYLLDEPYPHKPPLLFWGMHLGWCLIGVSEWWARSVAPLFGLMTLSLAGPVARVLWPERPQVARLAPWLLAGTWFWSVFATLTMFDLLMAACTLSGALGLALAALRGRTGGFVLTTVAIACGILAKGPVVLVHLVPSMLLAPWWASIPNTRWWRWYGTCAVCVLIGIELALCWVVPAALHGGQDYGVAILWSQSAGRISDTDGAQLNPHHHRWWWLIPFVPVVLLPWSLWPPIWRALRHLRELSTEPGVRWCLSWCVPAFVVHCCISGKQAHYLIPLVAPALLLGARLLDQQPVVGTRRDRWPLVTVLGLVAIALLIVPQLDGSTLARWGAGNRETMPESWGQAIGVLPGLMMALIVAGWAAWPPAGVVPTVRQLAFTGAALLVALHLSLMSAVRPAYDLEPIARRIATWQEAGTPVARVGVYRAEYQFLGRLRQPPEVIDVDQVRTWVRQHPSGVLLMTFGSRNPLPPWMRPPSEDQPHRGVRLGIWRAAEAVINGDDG